MGIVKETKVNLCGVKLIITALIFILALNIQLEASAKTLEHNFYGAEYILKPGQSLNIKEKYKSAISFKSDDTSVVKEENGIITGRKGGVAIITIKNKNGKVNYIQIGVKSSSYIPGKRMGVYKVGKEIPSGEYVLIKDKRVKEETYVRAIIILKGQEEDADGIWLTGTNACFVTLKKGDTIDIDGGYAVPIKKVNKKLFSLNALNKNVKKMAKYPSTLWQNESWIKVGLGIQPGVYKVSPLTSTNGERGQVDIFKKTNVSYDTDRFTSKSGTKNFRITLKEGQYVRISNCTLKRIAGREIHEL